MGRPTNSDTLLRIETTQAPTRLRNLPSWLINQSALRAQRLATERFAAVGASRSQYSLLSALDEFGPASQIDLGRRCGFDRSDVAAIVDALATNKLVERRTDQSDRRRNVITLTQPGRRYLKKLDRVADAIQDELLAALSGREREQLTRLLLLALDPHPASDSFRSRNQ